MSELAASITSISNDFEVIFNAVAQPENPLHVVATPDEVGGRQESIDLPPHIMLRVFEFVHLYVRSSASVDKAYNSNDTLVRQALRCSMTEPRAGAPPQEELTVLQGGVLFKQPTSSNAKRCGPTKTTSDGLVSCSERYAENFAKKMAFLAEICKRGC